MPPAYRFGKPQRYAGSDLFFYPFPRAYALGSIEFFWYIALVRCTIEHNGEETKGSLPIVPEERRRPSACLGFYARPLVWDPSLPVFQRLRVLSRIVDWNISILRTSEIENETELQYHNSV